MASVLVAIPLEQPELGGEGYTSSPSATELLPETATLMDQEQAEQAQDAEPTLEAVIATVAIADPSSTVPTPETQDITTLVDAIQTPEKPQESADGKLPDDPGHAAPTETKARIEVDIDLPNQSINWGESDRVIQWELDTDAREKIAVGLTEVQTQAVQANPNVPMSGVWRPIPEIPNLFWGGLAAFNHVNEMVALGITHVVTARPIGHEHPDKSVYAPFQQLNVPAFDYDEEDMIRYFPFTNHFIGNALDQGKKVFVHCAAGISRSVTVVIAYLMTRKELSPTELLKKIKEVRREADPNDGFMTQLSLYKQLGLPTDLKNCAGYKKWLGSREQKVATMENRAPNPVLLAFADEVDAELTGEEKELDQAGENAGSTAVDAAALGPAEGSDSTPGPVVETDPASLPLPSPPAQAPEVENGDGALEETCENCPN